MEDGNLFDENIRNEIQRLYNKIVFQYMKVLRRRLRDMSNPFMMPMQYFMRDYRCLYL